MQTRTTTLMTRTISGTRTQTSRQTDRDRDRDRDRERGSAKDCPFSVSHTTTVIKYTLTFLIRNAEIRAHFAAHFLNSNGAISFRLRRQDCHSWAVPWEM